MIARRLLLESGGLLLIEDGGAIDMSYTEPVIRFRPAHDITAYELAVLLAPLVRAPVDSHSPLWRHFG